MGMSARERAYINRVVNPAMIALITRGLGPPTYAVVETTGRKTGRVNPRVRVIARPARLRDGLRTRSRTGTAHLVPEDDADARHRLLGRGRPLYRLDGMILRRLANGGNMLTIRIDLD